MDAYSVQSESLVDSPAGAPGADLTGLLPRGFEIFHSVKLDPKVVTAAKAGDASKVSEAVQQQGQDLNAQDQYGQTALHVAASSANWEVAKAVLQMSRGYKFDINLQDIHGRTALAAAAVTDASQVVDLLLKAGADVNATDAWGNTPLMLASDNGSMKSLWLLIDHKVTDLDATDRHGATALLMACRKGNEECAQQLVDAGASLNEANQCGQTALHMACLCCSLNLVQKLHTAGADLQARDCEGFGAIHWAADNDVRAYLENELRKFALYRQQYVVPLARLPYVGRQSWVLGAVDLEKGCPVVLKFYKKKSVRNRALESILKLDQDYIASTPADTHGELPRYLFKDSSGYEGTPYCLVLYAGQRSLEDILSSSTRPSPLIPQQEVNHIFRSMAECVEHVHMNGVVHCNLKPRNVMQFFDGHFRLINLEAACPEGSLQQTHTTTLEICPPEVAKAWLREVPLEVTRERDIWALGCVLYEVMVGRKLLADIVQEVEENIAKGGAAPPQVPPSEVLGILHIISLLTQEHIDELVSVPSLLQKRMAHIELDGPSAGTGVSKNVSRMKNLQQRFKAPKKKLPLSPKSLFNPSQVSFSDDTDDRRSWPEDHQQQTVEIKRGNRSAAVLAETEATEEDDGYINAITRISELLSSMLRVDDRERPTVMDVLESPAMRIEFAGEADIAGDIKSLKRTALRNQTQLMGKMSEVTSGLERLVMAVSESGASTIDDDTSSIGGRSHLSTGSRRRSKSKADRVARHPVMTSRDAVVMESGRPPMGPPGAEQQPQQQMASAGSGGITKPKSLIPKIFRKSAKKSASRTTAPPQAGPPSSGGSPS